MGQPQEHNFQYKQPHMDGIYGGLLCFCSRIQFDPQQIPNIRWTHYSQITICINQTIHWEGLPKGALHTCLYLPWKSNVNVCLHCFVQSSLLKWIEIMLFHICKTQPGLKIGRKMRTFWKYSKLEVHWTEFMGINRNELKNLALFIQTVSHTVRS